MMKQNISILLVVVAALLLAAKPFAELPKQVQKKTVKAMAQLWPDTEVGMHELEDYSELSASKIGILGAYRLTINNTWAGYLVVARGRSKYDDFEYAVFYDNKLNIKATRILVYREDVGGEIGSKRWLRQFEGKNIHDKIILDNDIQGISGATISCRATVDGVRSITAWINKIHTSNGTEQ